MSPELIARLVVCGGTIFPQSQQAMSAEGSSYGGSRPLVAASMTPETRTMLQETYYPGYSGEPEGSGAMTLDSLADPPPGAKPRYPYSTLIRWVWNYMS